MEEYHCLLLIVEVGLARHIISRISSVVLCCGCVVASWWNLERRI